MSAPFNPSARLEEPNGRLFRFAPLPPDTNFEIYVYDGVPFRRVQDADRPFVFRRCVDYFTLRDFRPEAEAPPAVGPEPELTAAEVGELWLLCGRDPERFGSLVQFAAGRRARLRRRDPAPSFDGKADARAELREYGLST